MKRAFIFKPIFHIALVAVALCLLSLVSTKSANASGVLQCRGPTLNSVVACCERETRILRPAWMVGGGLSCNEVAACGGVKKSKERCRISIPDLQNPSHEVSSSRQVPSDIRLKTNIHKVGTTVLGLPLYSFEYRGKPGTYVGVMAQDVLKIEPSAVSKGADGFYRVDYEKLGIELLQLD